MARSPVWPDDVIASETASRHQPMNWRDSIWAQTRSRGRRSRCVKLSYAVLSYLWKRTPSADKRQTELYKSDYFANFLPYIHNKSFRHVTVCFFTHTDWFYAVNPCCSSLNCCFRLQITVHRLAVLLTVFWRKKRTKSVSAEKWKSYECRSYLFSVSMKLQFHNTWITLTSNSKMLQIFFYCA